jgi:membrane protein YqaA with SNARE-associated domain
VLVARLPRLGTHKANDKKTGWHILFLLSFRVISDPILNGVADSAVFVSIAGIALAFRYLFIAYVFIRDIDRFNAVFR